MVAALGLLVGACAQSHAISADCGFGLGGSPICDPGALRAALASAHRGDVVRIGVCTVAGPLEVPAGVTLVGSGRTATTVTAGEGGAIVVHGGLDRSRVTCLGIDVANGAAAVRADGPGGVAIDSLDVHVERGVGIDARDLGSLTVATTRLEGPVTRENATSVSPTPTPMDSATVGISVVRVGEVTVSELEVTGFADFAAVASESQSSWRAVDVHDTLGTALAVVGGTATLEDVRVTDTLGGARLLPAYGLVVAMDATVRSTGLAIERSEGYGVLQDSATAEHDMLTVAGSAEAGVWVQSSPAIAFVGADVRDNGGAGIALLAVESVRVIDTTVSGTQMRRRVCELRVGDVGDGLQLRDVPVASLDHVASRDNARVGILLQVPADGSALPTFSRVAVSGTGAQLGAVAVDRRGLVVSPPGWDTGIVREGATTTNDPTAIGTTVGPPCAM